jgi:hypothetical protein
VSEGISIVIRAGDSLVGVDGFLLSLLKNNSYKPVEVLLWAEDSQQALAIRRVYFVKIPVFILPPGKSKLRRIIQQVRYNKLLFVDLPLRITTDCILHWVSAGKSDNEKALLCEKMHLMEFADMSITTPLIDLDETIARKAKVSRSKAAPAAELDREMFTTHPKTNLKASVTSKAVLTHQQLVDKDLGPRFGWLKPRTLPLRIPSLENSSDNFSSKEIHRCTLFPPYKSTKEKGKLPFRILSLVEERMQECLSFDADVLSLDLSVWEKQLVASTSFVLIESGPKVLQLENDTRFKKFLDRCNERGVPTVFWHTEAKESCSMYVDIANIVGYVGAVERESVTYYERHTKASVRLLEHAIQPALHNGIREEFREPAYSNLRFFLDGWADVIEYRNEYARFLQPLRELGLHIFDSRWQFMKNKLLETPHLIKNIHGVIDARERLNAVKNFDVCVLAMPTMKSSSTLIIDALEFVASKRVVLSRGAFDLPMLSKLIIQCSSDDEFIACATRLFEYPAYRNEFAHKAWRYVHIHHTFVNRLNLLAQWIGLDACLEPLPTVASITVTKRPELLLTNAKRNYMQQAVQRKEWVIVLNTLDVVVKDIEESLRDVPNVRVYQVASDKNIGFCLNMAIAKCDSEYWAKMDDDDFYGPNYLMDYMLNLNSVNADLIGKLPSFVYLENEDALYFRHPANFERANTVLMAGKLYLSGATFVGRRNPNVKIPFSETIRSAVDSTWLRDTQSAGIKVIISDCYEMILFRASDKSNHTWRLDDDDLKRKSVRVCSGNGLSLANL